MDRADLTAVPPSCPPPCANRSRGPIRSALRTGAAALILAPFLASLAACSGDVVRSLASDAGYGPRVVAAPDFVAESRGTGQTDYMPVGVDAPKRALRAKSTVGQQALEAELEGARGRNQARGRAAASAGQGAATAIKPVPPSP